MWFNKLLGEMQDVSRQPKSNRGYSLSLAYDYEGETEKIIEFMQGCKILETRANTLKSYVDGINKEVLCDHPSFLLEHPEDKKHYVVHIDPIQFGWNLYEVVYDK